ncbi:SMI1/KNR4 family protein [Pseudomonas fluorescens]|uniref:SMI1/KNR4 family protein n=1 Tax=Pseudomonas TaxID=286 RepID=UPI003D06E7A9
MSEFLSFSPIIRPYTVSWYSRVGGVPGLPQGMFPIARDAGDYLICLDFNKPSIAVEIFDPSSGKTYFAASNFDKFIGSWSE